ncbi:hypothetical protein N499_1261B, partial [Wolbachia pipientis wVitA]
AIPVSATRMTKKGALG